VAEAAAAVAAAMQPVAKGAAVAARAKSAVVCALAKQLLCEVTLRAAVAAMVKATTTNSSG
jgi:hypothetical protein